MKKMIIALVAVIVGLIIVLIGFTIHGRGLRQKEVDNALKFSMEYAMESLLYEEGSPQTEEEWKQLFLQSLVEQIKSDSDLTVHILEADMDKGILSVEAVLEWRHPIGTMGSVSSQRTAIIEKHN